MTDCFATDKDGNIIQIEDTIVNIKKADPDPVKPEIVPPSVPAADANGEVKGNDVVDDPLPESLEPKKKIDFSF